MAILEVPELARPRSMLRARMPAGGPGLALFGRRSGIVVWGLA